MFFFFYLRSMKWKTLTLINFTEGQSQSKGYLERKFMLEWLNIWRGLFCETSISFSAVGINTGHLSKHMKYFILRDYIIRNKWTLNESIKSIDGIFIVHWAVCWVYWNYTKALGRSSCVLCISSFVIKTI